MSCLLRFERNPGGHRDFSELAFGPGGSFGTDLYASTNTSGTDFNFGTVWRITPGGALTNFGTQTPPSPPAFKFGAGGIAFATGGAFGDSMYTGTSAVDRVVHE